jgi:hypothetical protein
MIEDVFEQKLRLLFPVFSSSAFQGAGGTPKTDATEHTVGLANNIPKDPAKHIDNGQGLWWRGRRAVGVIAILTDRWHKRHGVPPTLPIIYQIFCHQR